MVKILSSIGIIILKIKFDKLLFSHNFYSSHFKKNKSKYFFNFLLYRFQLSSVSIKKKYDLIFYLSNHENKKNKFLIDLIIKLSKEYRICIIGKKIAKRENIKNMGYLSRSKVFKLINMSKASVSTYENLFSFFLLDCLKHKLIVFYNNEFNPKGNLDTKLMIPIDFNNSSKTIKIIKKNINKKISNKISYTKKNFNNYFKIH